MTESLARSILRLAGVATIFVGLLLLAIEGAQLAVPREASVRYATFVPDGGGPDRFDAECWVAAAVVSLFGTALFFVSPRLARLIVA